MVIDTNTEFGRRVAQRLSDDDLLWLTTVSRDGTPQPSLIWFHWDGETVLIYSQPDTPKLRNIAENPRVSLHFQANLEGAQAAYTSLRPIVADRRPALAKRVDRGFDQVQQSLLEYRSGDTYVTYDKLTKSDVRKLAQSVDGLSEPLSQVSTVVLR